MPRAMTMLSLASFICSGSILAKLEICILTFSNTGHSHRMCTTFPFLHRFSCMMESLLSSLCAAYNADWYTQSGAPPTFCNVSYRVYLWTSHTYRLVPPDTVVWSHTFHRLAILSISSFQSNFPNFCVNPSLKF